MLRTYGEADVFVDPVPLELNFVYARLMIEEGEPSFISTGFLKGDGSFISAVILPEPEIVPIIEETKSEISVSASFEKPPKRDLCLCGEYIKNFYPHLKGKQIYNPMYFWRHFEDYGMEKTELEKGAIVILKTDNYTGHTGIVMEIYEDSFKILEANWEYCKIGTRIIKLDNSDIVGYLR